MKREFQCKGCGVIITGKKNRLGEVVADRGPPDLTQTKPDPCICVSCKERSPEVSL